MVNQIYKKSTKQLFKSSVKRSISLLRVGMSMVMIFMVVPINAGGSEVVGPNSRAEATKIIADMRRIVTPEGIERLETVQIGGIEQWVSIRGAEPRNPVLLFIHGGPGYVAMPTSWYFQTGWDEYFTVVQWDQRGAGKTYLSNEPEKIAPTMTRQRMILDTVEMINWLRKEFKKDKIFILGHSWGSVIGLEVAQRHPELLHAYIGVGQGINGPEGERRGWQWTMEQARETGNTEAIRELESIAPYATDGELPELEDIYLQRKWLNYFGGAAYRRTGAAAESAAARLAPEYSDADVKTIWEANAFSEKHLLVDALNTDFSSVTKLNVPVIIFNGRYDYNVSQSVAAEWFERLEAPWKKLVWFEHSAHEIMNEEPGKMLVSLVQYARPLADNKYNTVEK